jgi:AraC-like DNA-binding protein/mannose-6-phosphate isomerase-like protein (cupin superfamily)
MSNHPSAQPDHILSLAEQYIADHHALPDRSRRTGVDLMSSYQIYNVPNMPVYFGREKLSDFYQMRTESHWNEDLEILSITEGTMKVTINTKVFVLEVGDILIVNCRQMHFMHQNGTDDCSYLCALVNPSIFPQNHALREELFDFAVTNPRLEGLYLSHDDPNSTKVNNLIRYAAAAFRERSEGYKYKLLSSFFLLMSISFFVFHKEIMEASEVNSPDILSLRKMLREIQDRYGEKLTLAQIAASGHVSRSKCCTIFRKYMHTSPVAYLNNYRLSSSRALLADDSLSIAEIASHCGFTHQSYFTRMFDKAYGITPLLYRREYQKQKEEADQRIGLSLTDTERSW